MKDSYISKMYVYLKEITRILGECFKSTLKVSYVHEANMLVTWFKLVELRQKKVINTFSCIMFQARKLRISKQ